MTKSVIDISDNDCTKVSPCRDCHWHIQGIEKNRCIKICQRLKSYREGHEYNHLPWPKLEDLQDIQGVHPVIEDKIPLKNKKHKAKLSHTLQKTKKTDSIMLMTKKTPVKRNKDDIDKIVDKIAKRVAKVKVIVDPIPEKPVARRRRSLPSVRLYLTRYPKIKDFITEMAEDQGLPSSHVALTLLSEAIIARKKRKD